MTRKRAEKKSKKTYKKIYSKIIPVIIIIIIIAISSIAAILYLPSEKNNETGKPDGKWLFAMDTDNIVYKYQVGAIPTLVIIDKNGDITYYKSATHYKEQLLPNIESAIQGTSESLGESIDFTVTTFNGEEFTLSEHKGEVILLDIMGVGCYPCELQMPELKEIDQEMDDKVVILSVDSCWYGETEKDVRDVYGEYILE